MGSEPAEKRNVLEMDKEITILRRANKQYKKDNSSLKAKLEDMTSERDKWKDVALAKEEVHRVQDKRLAETKLKLAEVLKDHEGVNREGQRVHADLIKAEKRIKILKKALSEIYIHGAQACAAFNEYKISGKALDYWLSEAQRESAEARKLYDKVK